MNILFFRVETSKGQNKAKFIFYFDGGSRKEMSEILEI